MTDNGHEESKEVESAVDCPKFINLACEKIRSDLDLHSVDSSVREDLNHYACFSQFAVGLYLPENYKQYLEFNAPLIGSVDTGSRIWVKDNMSPGTMQHNRRIVAIQQLTYAHVALECRGRREDVLRWVQQCEEGSAGVGDLKNLRGYELATASYAALKIPRCPEAYAVTDADKHEKCIYGYNCADALRLQRCATK